MHNIQLKLESEKIARVSDHVSIIGGVVWAGTYPPLCRKLMSMSLVYIRLISILLGRFKMETPVAIEAYEQFCNDVYGNEHGSLTKTRYDSMIFEKTFRIIAQNAGFNADDPMEEENAKCKTCVPSLSESRSGC